MTEQRYTNPEALKFHETGKPGKVALAPTKPLLTQRDLALAYSPGVAAPVHEIADDPANAYKYTAKGNYVAVVSNGTAILGLGDLGALASKPVMEGKSVLFKRFADIDSVDVEVDTTDPEAFINCVRYLGPSWGGINLEDIKAPDCFIIENKLKELMDIPVFHDDQHGTAIVTAAALINAAHLTGRKLSDMKLVVLGAGSAGIACLELVKRMGLKQALLVDREGVIYKGRTKGMNEWKEKHAIETTDRTLEDAMTNADAFYGLAGKGAVTKEMVKSMAKNPIIFAMANPDPEITPAEVAEVRGDAIMATGRSDYPNQVNNVLGFPYIFRGALDVQASTINEEMKVAAAEALAELAREAVPLEVIAAVKRTDMEFGPNYIIPSAFDPRLISTIPVAVAKAAIKTGVARKKITDWEGYKRELAGRLNPTANVLSLIYKKLRNNPKTVIFAEGEEEVTIRAAMQWVESGYGKVILVGREEKIEEQAKKLGAKKLKDVKVVNAYKNEVSEKYVDFLYKKLARKGYLKRDCNREIRNDRNVFASVLLAKGEGDILITGLTRSYSSCLKTLMQVIGAKKGERVFGTTIAVGANNKTIFISDTAVHVNPDAEQLAQIAIATAELAKKMGEEPRAALLSYSNFGNPNHEKSKTIKDALKILEGKKVKFEFDGDLTPDVALNDELLKLYPTNLKASANCLIMPSLEAANISGKMLRELGGGTLIGPVLHGFDKPAQIVPMNASVSDILNIAAIASVEE
ncbi:MAG: NADP-dependent malic enzyme [Rickettsiales bacterium]|nr:NADP-dependent malic enzyme [Rickettsiales bacterium]